MYSFVTLRIAHGTLSARQYSIPMGLFETDHPWASCRLTRSLTMPLPQTVEWSIWNTNDNCLRTQWEPKLLYSTNLCILLFSNLPIKAIAERITTMDVERGHFGSNLIVNWYWSPIDLDTLSKLVVQSDLRGWIQTLLHLGLFFVTATLAYFVYVQIRASNWYWSVPLPFVVLFLHSTIGPFMGLIAIHKLQHRTVFKTRWLNDYFERLYAFIS